MGYALLTNLPEIALGVAWTGLIFWFGRWSTTILARKNAKTK